jgi:hypothetical protein
MPVRWRSRLYIAGLIGAVIVLPALLFGRGGVGYWSPDSLEGYTQREYVTPIFHIPIYRSLRSLRRYELVDFLVAKGYWSPRKAAGTPRLLLMFRWNDLWKDGYSGIHREFTRSGPFWQEWTTSHPSAAAELWPRVLESLRTWPHGNYYAVQLLFLSRDSQTAEDVHSTFEALELEMRSSGY